MGKFFSFWILWILTGNPFMALLILLVIVYFLDRRFVGLFPSVTRPFRRNNQLRKLRHSLQLNPHNTSDKRELARLLMEKKRFRQALPYLEEVLKVIPESAEIRAEIGLCHLKLGDLEQGERMMLDALELDPRVHYGEPHLRLGEAFRSSDQKKSLHHLEKFQEIQSSSSEAHYRLGRLYAQMDRRQESKEAFREAIAIYHSLPKYKKRTERPWALRSRFRLMM
ncbi:hypothetical protein GCM10007416_21200 [Kroppenstedtia guangzhouensis]|uniref:Tetratricopeptide repeat-containing protein n=1 Tax=Kroppenstedtia guangzhouensis TaxID=1274356 RepID=A0ABQ1GPJ4_9BACL|nr:tetratricopeptide repeat protein [Kroppenstedtia guangzhouensis]GGA47796.1 hypothetical protein GCM10007416_21200 [Kroppenstedtia guangzhouensis]